MSVFDMFGGGFSLSSPSSSDAGLYAPVTSQGTTGEFNFGFGAKKQGLDIPVEYFAIAGLLAWFILSKR